MRDIVNFDGSAKSRKREREEETKKEGRTIIPNGQSNNRKM